MKIAVVHNQYNVYGGEDACVENEISALREEKIDVVEFRVRNQPNFQAKINALTAPVGGGDEKKLENFISREHPDIIHAHNLFPLFSPRLFKISQKRGIKNVLTLHNYRPLCLNGLFLTPRNALCERCTSGNYLHGIVRGCYRKNRLQSLGLASHLWAARSAGWYDAVDLFIAPGDFLKNRFVKNGFPENKIVVQGHFLPHERAAEVIAPEPYVLYLGRLSEEKGIRWLLDVFRQSLLPIKLIVAGTGPLRNEVEKACGDSIRYVGYVEGKEKERLLQHATTLAIPSECYENFPLVVAEANAWGTPALVCDQGGLSDMVVPDENGERYIPRDIESFWKNLKKITHCPDAMALRNKCQKYARGRFSKGEFIKKRVALYENLISRKN